MRHRFLILFPGGVTGDVGGQVLGGTDGSRGRCGNRLAAGSRVAQPLPVSRIGCTGLTGRDLPASS